MNDRTHEYENLTRIDYPKAHEDSQAPTLTREAVHDTYHAATVDELRKNSSLRRLLAIANQQMLFPHRGRITLSEDRLCLGSWRTVMPKEVAQVSMGFLPEYSRVAAAGARGGFPSFGALRRLGAPLVLDLRTGERIALLIGYTWWSGTTKNAHWFPALKAFAAQSTWNRQ